MQEQFTTAEVGELIGRSAAHVRSLIKRGELGAERLPGVGYRVQFDDWKARACSLAGRATPRFVAVRPRLALVSALPWTAR